MRNDNFKFVQLNIKHLLYFDISSVSNDFGFNSLIFFFKKQQQPYLNVLESKFDLTLNILSVNEKLPVSKFQYFGKYIIQLFGYCYVHFSGQRQAGLER